MQHLHNRLMLTASFVCLAASACSGTEASSSSSSSSSTGGASSSSSGGTGCNVSVPATFSAPDWDTNAAEALALRARLDQLVGSATMRGAEQGTVALPGGTADLAAVLEGGTPSLSGVVTSSYRPVVDAAFAEFVAAVAAGPQDMVSDQGVFVPGTQGGIAGDSFRTFNEGGLEVRQLVDKGLFAGGALYNYALGLTAGTITPATVEAMAAAWGANSTLDSTGALTDSANYTHGMGHHARVAQSLRAAHAFAADAACTAERDAAVVQFFRDWETAMLARLVFYANDAAGALNAATVDNDRVEAMHDLSEGIGLALGFRGLASPATGPLAGAGRVITDAQIDAIAAALGVNLTDLGASTTGGFMSESTAFSNAIGTVESTVMQAYGLQASDIAAFRTPTPG